MIETSAIQFGICSISSSEVLLCAMSTLYLMGVLYVGPFTSKTMELFCKGTTINDIYNKLEYGGTLLQMLNYLLACLLANESIDGDLAGNVLVVGNVFWAFMYFVK